MMYVKDLMINDWVSINDSNFQVKVIKKKGVIKLYENTKWGPHEIEFNSDYLEDSIQPIPLTEEILHNNGFKNDVIAQKSIIAEGASNFSVILISEDNRITLNNIDEYLNSFNKWYIHIDTEDMRTMCTAEITYVHELQHLLKLCKIEKEIIL